MPRLLSRDDIETSFRRLGELAQADGENLQFVVLGGTAMVLGFDARPSTKDVDFAPLMATNITILRRLAEQVGGELGWDESWMNDAAKGYLHGPLSLIPVYNAFGIEVFRPVTEQLLAMKLAAWRDDVDIADAELLMGQLAATTMDEVWARIHEFVIPDSELKVKYALEDLWNSRS